MTVRVGYCKSWFRADKQAIEPWSEDRARAAHNEKKLYTALVGDPARPTSFLEINAGYVGVGFLDSLLRERLVYQFLEKEPGRLFLVKAIHREYVERADEVRLATVYIFSPDGKVEIRKDHISSRTVETAESEFDAERNWEKFPEFGRYENLIQIERWPV